MTRHILLVTDRSFRVRGRSYPNVPILITSSGNVIEPASDWLRYLALEGAYKPSTWHTYGEALRLFWNQLRSKKWDEVDNDFLLLWRTAQENNSVHRRTINARLTVVFRFYLWAQQSGLLRSFVGVPGWDEEGKRHTVYPLAAKVSTASVRGGKTRNTLVSSLLFPNPGVKRDLHTPTDGEARAIHAVLSAAKNPGVAERNTLMASWAEEVGLRRKEFLGLQIGQIPDWGAIYDLIDGEALYELKVTVTKGGKARVARVTPELLLRTREYIDYPRAEVVKKVRARRRPQRDLGALFISHTSGQQLAERSVSNLLGKAFREAGVPAWGHRLRALFLTNLTERYFLVEFSKHGKRFDPFTVMLRVAEAAGHSRLESLRPYLNLVRKRHFAAGGAQQTVDGSARTMSALRFVEQRLRLLAADEGFAGELSEAIGSNAGSHSATAVNALLTKLVSDISLPRST